MAVGICKAVVPCKRDGTFGPAGFAATAPDAVSLFFSMDSNTASPPQDQLDLKHDIERTLHAIQLLFPEPSDEAEFRPYFAQLFALASLGLVGPTAMPAIAKSALVGLVGELIDREGGHVKNAHLRKLAWWGTVFSLPFLFVYLMLSLLEPQGPWVMSLLRPLHVDRLTLSSFMLLWVGCFLGVVLSYGIRTTAMTLDDLINTDADRLLPQVRLIFAGGLTMLFGLFLVLGIPELKIGEVSSRDIASYPMLAFLIGALCGISELALPSDVTKKATNLLGLK